MTAGRIGEVARVVILGLAGARQRHERLKRLYERAIWSFNREVSDNSGLGNGSAVPPCKGVDGPSGVGVDGDGGESSLGLSEELPQTLSTSTGTSACETSNSGSC